MEEPLSEDDDVLLAPVAAASAPRANPFFDFPFEPFSAFAAAVAAVAELGALVALALLLRVPVEAPDCRPPVF